MKKLSTTILILIAFLMASCVPSSPSKKRKKSSTDVGVKKSGGTTTLPNFESGESLYWYSGTKVEGTITLNENTNTVIYIRGKELHDFLNIGSNFSLSYCMVASYSSSAAQSHLKFRAVPISFNNITNGTNEKLLRIDIPEKSINSTVCDAVGGNEPVFINSNGVLGAPVTDVNSAFSLDELCPSCSGIIPSTSINLYLSGNGNISASDLVPTTGLDLRSLGLRVDVKNNSTEETSSCTNTGCSAKGFDCCSDGQCVNDAEEKPNASSESDYAQALADIGINPANFINYPNVFFICSSNQVVEPTPTPLPDASAVAAAKLLKDIADFNCLEGAKESPANYLNCSPGSDETSFKNTRADVWSRCGCQADPFPTEPSNPQCPDFGLEAIRDISQNITNIVCYIPPLVTDPTPFQNLSLNLPSRSAPHRFYDSAGNSVDDISTLLNIVPAVVQEGIEFSYLDEVGKTDPISGAFNMNSILGQFKVNLSRAIPAKTLLVELDQTYIIAAVNGYSTPCPQCANDAWFTNFSAHPQTTGGNGLSWTGYSTNRRNFQGNLTNGNFEDTIFGRACWLPPTMIPFSHKKNSDVKAQRRNRLATQAAYYSNGYQRDWFGFNKGALIGSFDGVTWFAIGNGRRVTSSSTKLFLAINAPFADLAEPSSVLVNIITDNGNNTAPSFDWDPSLPPNHSDQNQGATCQYHHQCNVDSDCVAKLGWEYVCADTSRYKTKWPKFSSNANETANEEFTNGTFANILQGNRPPGSSNKCVYRGAGAPCKQDYTSNLNSADAELFTCAPNFYCSSLTSSDFNKEVVRSPNLIESIIFGQEANILGRPMSYLRGNSSLNDEIKSNIEHNATIFTSQVGDWGICRPGKRLHQDPSEQHQNSDSSSRTDYINQISSCNSNATGSSRVQACPVFETAATAITEVGNYLIDFSSSTLAKKSEQNQCGAESQKVQGINTVSTFEQIEAGTLVSVNNLLNQTVVKDACLRRAGAVCHTNLDCSPSTLHAEQASFFGLDYFGNTEAEKKYWEESLICGQAQEQPYITSTEYFDYDITKNKCCRAVGNDFTMYTEGDAVLIPDLGIDNANLVTDRLPSNDPAADGRYSRFAVATPQRNGNGALAGPVAETPTISASTTPKAFQWKTFNDTGKKNCCGGGWVRKFADGTTDWSNANRLQLDVTKLSCLNYKNELVFKKPNEVNAFNFNQDLNYVCRAPGDGGCIQNEIPIATGFEITYPSDVGALIGSINTTPSVPPAPGAACEQTMNVDGPYIPRYYNNTGDEIYLSTDQCRNYLQAPIDNKFGISLYLPTYIGTNANTPSATNNIVDVIVHFMTTNGALVGSASLTNASPAGACVMPTSPSNSGLLGNPFVPGVNDGFYCLGNDPITGATIIHLAANPNAPAAALWDYAGIEIRYETLQSENYNHLTLPTCDATPGVAGTTRCDNGMEPGNSLYYLTKLARLELLGVPQIFYEPLYCNSNRSKMVGGIFDTTDETRLAFDAISFDYDPAKNGQSLEQIYTSAVTGTDDSATDTALDENIASGSHPNGKITFQNNVSLPQVFSGHEFKCCIELGEKTTEAAKCCSSFAATDGSDTVCKLPSRTNLNVYFNKFISSEGIGEERPGGGLTESDFVPLTGEPKISISVNNKLIALGMAYCASGQTRKGASFGFFYGEPNNGSFIQTNQSEDDSKRFSILDSTNDIDLDNDSGFPQFQQGLRWDHQFYCN